MQRWFGATLLLACLPVHADLIEEVRCREVGFSLAAERQDSAAFASYIDEDARFVGSAVYRGRAAVVQAWGVFFAEDGPRIRWRPQFVEVLQDGNLALTRGPYRMTATDGEGKVNETWGTFNSVWRVNEDGQWRVVFDAGSEAPGSPDAAAMALLEEPHSCDRAGG